MSAYNLIGFKVMNKGYIIPFFRHTPITTICKNRRFLMGVFVIPIKLYAIHRSLRFMCVSFGWRTFFIYKGATIS